VKINNYSVFCGTIICNNGALGALNTGVVLNGRALTTDGALTTTAMTDNVPMLPGGCTTLGAFSINGKNAGETATIYPNPFRKSTVISMSGAFQLKNAELIMYNVLGEEVMNINITQQSTTLETANLPSGIYFYQLINDNTLIQSGKLVAQN
jgi:Secretion system C-terminal sorting domain